MTKVEHEVRMLIKALVFLSFVFSSSVTLAEVRCYAKRYTSTADARAAHKRCVREQTFGLDDVIAGINNAFDSDEDEPETIDPDIYNEARSEARADSLDCDEDDANAVKSLFAGCTSASKFVRVGNTNRYRCTIVSNALYMYLITSGESFSRVAVIGINDNKKAEVKFNCAK